MKISATAPATATRLRVGHVLFVGLSSCVIPISNTNGGNTTGGLPDASALADAQTSFNDAATNVADGEAGMPAPGPPLSDGETAPTADCVEAGTCPAGTWVNVTPASMPAAVLAPVANSYGPGTVVVDPARPTDLYIGAAAGLWKSTDYGTTWTQIYTGLPTPPMGVTIAVAGTTPATIWAADRDGSIYRSTDGGSTFVHTGMPLPASLYSVQVDPTDPTHLLSGLHEVDGVYESKDSGDTWSLVGGAGFPTGAISWFPYFINTGNATTTSRTWIAVPQNGGSTVLTSDGGGHWSAPAGLSAVQHPVGSTQIYQTGSTLFVAYGSGVVRSTDLGATWSVVEHGTAEDIVWGTPKNVYAMWGYACSPCMDSPKFMVAPQPGDTWSAVNVPAGIPVGPLDVAVTYDGVHYIAVGVFWGYGIWRYIEP
jgi:hypothetical protein